MKELTQNELREVQIGILDYVHNFCQENNIKYSLACGTLLGAVRHQGYIPWDDDIDIYMLRPDYEQFLRVFPFKKAKFVVGALENRKDYFYYIAKVENTDTILEEYINVRTKIGVNIDIFPLDNVPDNLFLRKLFFKLVSVLNAIIVLKNVSIKSDRAFLKNAILLIGRIFFSFIPMRLILCAMNSFPKLFNGRQTKQISEVSANAGVFNRSVMDEIIMLPFENKEYCAMKDYHQYLTAQYGDYMQLPPEEKRITHHAFKAYWKD